MRRLHKSLGTTLGAAAATAILIATPQLVTPSAAPNPDYKSATSSQKDPVPDEAWAQLRSNSHIVVGEFDPQSASYVRTSRSEREDHRVDGGPVSLEAASERAADEVGLSRESILSASLVSVSAFAHGYVVESPEGDPEVIPIYDGTAAWALEFGNVHIPVGQRVPDTGKGAPGGEYIASMIIFVDAYTGGFMFGSQYDRG